MTPTPERPVPAPKQGWLYSPVIFLSAFLLFQVQLISAKIILPWFGGGPAVWTTCMLFFQVGLLAGYAYSAQVTRLSGQTQSRLHLALVGLSVIQLALMGILWRTPITPPVQAKPAGTGDPTLYIVLLLTTSVGLPFFLLSTTSPLLQSWLARDAKLKSPYKLYAVSNLGSLLGLLTYPFLFEPWLRLRTQAWGWTLGYFFFAAGAGLCAWGVRGENAPMPADLPRVSLPKLRDHLLWGALAACSSVVLLATTNLISQDIAVIPLLWVLPLAIYLLSFILCFQSARWYPRWLYYPLFGVVTSASCNLLFRNTPIPASIGIPAFTLNLFVICSICHGELFRLKPAPQALTKFYLSIAAGSAIGGAFVSIIAPRIFDDFWELELGVGLCGILIVLALLHDSASWLWKQPAWVGLGAMYVFGMIPLAISLQYGVQLGGLLFKLLVGVLAATLLIVLWSLFAQKNDNRRLGWLKFCLLIFPVCFSAVMYLHTQTVRRNIIARSRNFYGTLSVWEMNKNNPSQRYYLEAFGKTTHGIQMQASQYRRSVTTYYSANSGVGIALTYHPRRWRQGEERNLRVGVVGLGVGTLAAYGVPGDLFRFYDINPRVIEYASGEKALFTFLKESPAKIEIVPGDARISMEHELRQGPQKYDVIVLDAFSSDAIPVHLLTKEAFDIYEQQLRDRDGIIAVHLSNRYLDLEPVVTRIAQHFALRGMKVVTQDEGAAVYNSVWVLLSHNQAIVTLPDTPQTRSYDLRTLHDPAGYPLWTDDYSNLATLLK